MTICEEGPKVSVPAAADMDWETFGLHLKLRHSDVFSAYATSSDRITHEWLHSRYNFEHVHTGAEPVSLVADSAPDWAMTLTSARWFNHGYPAPFIQLWFRPWDGNPWFADVVFVPETKYIWQPFLDAVGITIMDIKKDMVIDDRDRIVRIGNWILFPDPFRYEVERQFRDRDNFPWITRVG